MFKRLKRWAKRIKKHLLTLYFVLKRKDVPWYKKMFIGFVVSYAFSPVDFVPDFIPILGYLDDAILLPIGVILSMKLIKKEILISCQAQANNITVKPKSILFGLFVILFWMITLMYFGYRVYKWSF